jgi:VWFA-related protein
VLLLAAIAGILATQDPPRFTERVDVARVVIDVRALDGQGRPLLDLGASNFEVKIDGKRARVESALWVTGALTEIDVEPTLAAQPRNTAVAGRLVVLLFQKDLEKSRITGLMRMLLNLRGFLDSFTSHDRLAVLTFDSRLRLWLDFTGDMDRVRDVLERNVLFGGTPPTADAHAPSLRASLDTHEAARASTIESSLRLIAEALAPLPGAKTVILVGHGFGARQVGDREPRTDYGAARDALQKARASVFCLDVTDADAHTLESGLQIVAGDTGGTYERTHLFARAALNRLGSALASHYVLIVEKPELSRGYHEISVKLKGREGSVLARNAFYD